MMPNILQQIIVEKRMTLAAAKAHRPVIEIKRRCADLPPTHGFAEALEKPGIRIIAEAKQASPSKGRIVKTGFHVPSIVQAYEAGGAAACSILTEERFFLGSLDFLRQARQITKLPLLRKDFIFDAYQIFEARDAGADAVLLIAAMLEDAQLEDLAAQASVLGLDVLGEAHIQEEVARLAALGIRIIGVNARDLKTFRTDLSAVRTLLREVPPTSLAVAESAIFSKADMHATGATRFLIGEALRRNPSLLPELLA